MDAEQYIFAHPHLTTVLNKSIQAIHASHPVRVVRVIGPPGVGKSTLLRLIEKQLIEEALQDLEADRGRLPFIRVEAVAPEGGTFDWNDFDYRMLIAADEPLIDYKINPDFVGQHSARHSQGSTRQQRGRVDLRPALVRCLEHRRPYAILIDEGQHLIKVSGRHQLSAHVESILSLIASSKVMIILFGTYELLALRNIDTRIDICTIDIHFPRYHFGIKEDLLSFKRILLSYNQCLPLRNDINSDDVEFYYERSIGCVGLLNDWFYRSLFAAVEDNRAVLTRDYFDRHALDYTKLVRIAQETAEGEKKLKEMSESGTVADKENASSQLLKGGARKPKSRYGNKPRPGERKPKRDKVGE
jgi:energy-coupling factor transporter ATP-binding protein EcfA2